MQRRRILRLIIALLPATGMAYMRDYLPLKDAEVFHRVRQRILRSNFVQGGNANTVRVGLATVRFVEPANEIRFSGLDAMGKPWTVTADALRGGALYSADLDHNGKDDLIYAAYTGGNGLAPSMHVVILLFDTAGRPVPSEIDGYFEIDERGLKDLVDLDGDGRAELIRQSCRFSRWRPPRLCWRAQLRA